ncbi:MAG: hypothetical protein WEA31_09885 [Pirellulales bacterium]
MVVSQSLTALLEQLCSHEFVSKFSVIATPQAAREFLLETREVQTLRAKYEAGELTDGQLREWVDELLAEYRPGQAFESEWALCAIAVFLERYDNDLATEYLNDLTALSAPELSFASRVARTCLENRSKGMSSAR